MSSNTSIVRSLCIATLIGLTASQAAWAQDVPLRTKRIVGTGLGYPTRIAFPPGDDNNMYVTEKAGRIRRIDMTTGSLQAASVLDINPEVVGGSSTNDEQGLLGIAFHPDYPNTPYVYVNYTASSPSGWTVIKRFTMLNDTQADAGSGLIISQWSQPFNNHNGGWIGFGQDGYLYIGTGDGGSANDPAGRAQDITSQPLGKILRIDVDGDDFPADANKNYALVPENPFFGPTVGDDEILHYGIRNPWSCNFDLLTDDLWIGDVGQNVWEEISYAPAGSTGLNFGWRCMEGNACTGLSGCVCNDTALTDPVHVYGHNATGGNCVTGGLVYRGCEIPEAYGLYFFADYGSNRYWSIKLENGVATNFTVQTPNFTPSVDGFVCNQIVCFAQNNAGEMFLADHGSATLGQIFQVIRDPAAEPVADCDDDGTNDFCEILAGAVDCDANGTPDSCDIDSDPTQDCNGNGQIDQCEIDAGAADCDDNGVIDSCDISSGAAEDCNENGIPDSCDIDSGAETDENLNGIPDSCEESLPGDLDGDGEVGGADLAMLLGAWGKCPAKGECIGDINEDGLVNGADLAALLGGWTS